MKPRYDEQLDALIVERRAANYSVRLIAETFGIPTQRVRDALKRTEKKNRPRPYGA